MRISRILLITLGIFLFSSSNADYEVEEAYVEDALGNQHLFEREVRPNPDGSRTIIPRERPDELKRIHQQLCESVGATDITQEHVLTLGEGTVDAVVCHSDSQQGTPEGASASGGISLMNSSLQINPPNATVNLNANFLLSGSFYYQTLVGGPYDATMSASNCSTSISGNISGMGAGTRTLMMQCHAFDAGTYPSTLAACIPGLCASANGVITVNQ